MTSPVTSMSQQQESKVLRFKFTQSVMDEVLGFAKLHQYDDKASYKEAWDEWKDDNEDMIARETSRLIELGYEGSVINKMYKSGRYYFRTKSMEKTEPKKRRKYINMSKDIIQRMDQHINMHMGNEDFTPANGYENFCKTYVLDLKEEIGRIVAGGEITPEEIIQKVKKTYKNRYFQIKTK